MVVNRGRQMGNGNKLIKSLLQQEGLELLWQPIYCASAHEVIGYEAICRPAVGHAHCRRYQLWQLAARHDQLVRLEQLYQRMAIERFVDLGLKGQLWLWSHPAVVDEGEFNASELPQRAAQYGLDASRLVVLLRGDEGEVDTPLMRRAIQQWRREGVRPACQLDCLPLEFNPDWRDYAPDYCRIGQPWLLAIDESPPQQLALKSIIDQCGRQGCRLIAQGVVSELACRTLLDIGIDIFQGSYIAHPSFTPATTITRSLFNQKHQRDEAGLGSPMIGELAIRKITITPATRMEEAARLFQALPSLEILPVLEGQKPVGLVRRDRMMQILLSHYGRELHSRKPIRDFMERDPLIIDAYLTIEAASGLITAQMGRDRLLELLVVERGDYYGVVNIFDLLQRITELQIQNARHANPLTLLPGNAPICAQLDRALGAAQQFAVAYIDIDHFKPFNDHYGYDTGDQIIRLVASLLREQCVAQHDFIGHIGGDDFIVIFLSEDWYQRCEMILQRFAQEMPQFFTQQDIAANGYWGNDRSGEARFHPLCSLSIGVVQPDPARCRNHHDIATLASSAKKEAKKIAGNSLFVDRRSGVIAPSTTPPAV
jgi:diguanylate cyclase (GGDEF)-like protein